MAIYLTEILNRGVPPKAFVDETIATMKAFPDHYFESNPNIDIYTAVKAQLGPWKGTKHRRAVGIECMIILAGFESSWNHKEGIDKGNASSATSKCKEEAGAWQTSANAGDIAPEIKALLHGISCEEYIHKAKSDHKFSCEFTWMTLRHTTQHHGPVKRHAINEWLSESRVQKIMELL